MTTKQFKCIVPWCNEEWMYASTRKLKYCMNHHETALGIYYSYKNATESALEDFSDENLKKAISLRQKYDIDFLGGTFRGAHSEFIDLLQKLLVCNKKYRPQLFHRLIADFRKKYGTH